MNAQLDTDLAQSPTVGVQVGCPLNVHSATVTAQSPKDVVRGPTYWLRRIGPADSLVLRV
jgi:hypothetical protein